MRLRNDSKYVYWGATALAVIACGVLITLIFSNLTGFLDGLKKYIGVFSPVIYGVAFAYILNPLMCFAEKLLLPLFLKQKKRKPEAAKKWARAGGILFAFLIAALVIYGFLALLLPNLVKSLTTIASNMQNYYNTMQTWINDLVIHNPDYAEIIKTAYETIFTGVSTWLTNFLENDLSAFATTVASQLYLIVKGTGNILIGLVAAVYLLSSKETYQAQVKKVTVALMKRERADRIFAVCDHANGIFSGFINGKIVDSLIIGVICYVGMLVLNIPYPELISTIIGVTNVIPFFGPIIGAVPSTVIILLVDPMKALWFVIFVLILQQIDGNLIGPHILGDAVGLPSFWILFSITVFGSLFGFVGMLLGVPVFATGYTLFRELIEEKLKKKGAPVSTDYYRSMSSTKDLQDKLDADAVKRSEESFTEEELREAEKAFWK